MLEIISNRTKVLWHNHRCPLCKLVKYEPNEVCGMSLPHVFACLSCLKDYRLRLGTDVLVDVFIDLQQLERLERFAPDEKAIELDREGEENSRIQVAQILQRVKDPDLAKAAREAREKEYEWAKEQPPVTEDIITYDEAVAELEAGRKKMGVD